MTETLLPQTTAFTPPAKAVVPPAPGEVITSLLTGNTYTMGDKIGEGYFGVVFSCVDFWGNDLAAKVLKPTDTYDQVKASAEAEFRKLVVMRHPNITYIFDAFEYRHTFYIITERCYCPITQLFSLENFSGLVWLMPIGRCLLQAVHYIHLNKYAHQDIHLGNVFAAFIKDEMCPTEPGVIQFKLGDLGVAKLFNELDVTNTLAEWIRPPEAIDSAEFGPIDHRIDIYHIGLLLLQLAYSQELRFSRDEILAGRPRDMALKLPPPYNFALEKALRRHVAYRTESAMELWHDICQSQLPMIPSDKESGQ
ncbi:MAG TPA: protein kinase family protein [Syntrophaceae bacterium]|jgi:serine/threonine-protein kinase|nr:protein kinase family protein [Syntrophaceae bacterium]